MAHLQSVLFRSKARYTAATRTARSRRFNRLISKVYACLLRNRKANLSLLERHTEPGYIQESFCPINGSAAEGVGVGEGWRNQWGVMRLADFRARKTLREVGPSDLPQGSGRSAAGFREALAEFRRQLQPGDVLYFYDSDPEEWDMGFGSAGYAIVRDGELLDTLVVRMN